MSPELRRLLASVLLTSAVFAGSLHFRADWLASMGCITALFLGVPASILLYLDYVRARAQASTNGGTANLFFAVPIVLLGATSLALGLAIIAWVVFNILFGRQPSYSGHAWLPGFGIAPLLVVFGARLLRSPFRV